MTTDPGGNSAGSPAFGTLWQTQLLVIENNVFELPLSIHADQGAAAPAGVSIYGATRVSPYVFRRVVIRNNLIRHVDNLSDPTKHPIGISLDSCESALIENNIIDLDRTTPIEFEKSGQVKCFNNATSAGKLLRGYNMDTKLSQGELATAVEDVLLLSI